MTSGAHQPIPAAGEVSGSVPPVPVRLAHRPTVAGLVVPYVTPQAADGRFLFGVLDPRLLARCLTRHLCQVCGTGLERPVVLLMRQRDLPRRCVSEPALHPVCAAYTIRACPMVAGRMHHYRSTPVSVGGHVAPAADTAARLGPPSEVWYAVWLDGYHTMIDPINGLPAASFAGIRPRRIRRITPTNRSTPDHSQD